MKTMLGRRSGWPMTKRMLTVSGMKGCLSDAGRFGSKDTSGLMYVHILKPRSSHPSKIWDCCLTEYS